MTARATWRDDAACRDADPELFFPIGTTGPALVQIGEAKRICRACPAQAPCLAWALENGVADGIWGGTTHDERRGIRALLVTRPSAANTAAAVPVGRTRRTGNPRARRATTSTGRPTTARPLEDHPTRTERGNEDQGTGQDSTAPSRDHGDLGRGSAVGGSDAAGAVAG